MGHNKLRKFHVRIDEVSVDPKNECSHATNVNTCAIIYERDSDFGPVEVIDPSVKGLDKPDESLPSEKIDPIKLEHLTEDQQCELVAILDEFADCFFLKLLDFMTWWNIRYRSLRILNRRDLELTKSQNV